jgi:hypothetical protein
MEQLPLPGLGARRRQRPSGSGQLPCGADLPCGSGKLPCGAETVLRPSGSGRLPWGAGSGLRPSGSGQMPCGACTVACDHQATHPSTQLPQTVHSEPRPPSFGAACTPLVRLAARRVATRQTLTLCFMKASSLAGGGASGTAMVRPFNRLNVETVCSPRKWTRRVAAGPGEARTPTSARASRALGRPC